MKWTNNHGLPGPLYEAIQADDYPWNPDPKHFSVTELIQPIRITLLHQRYRDHITQDVSDALWSFLGRVAHKTLEGQRKGGRIQERRLQARSSTGPRPHPEPEDRFPEIDGWPADYWISGQMDLMESGVVVGKLGQHPDPMVLGMAEEGHTYSLVDFKVTSVYSFLLGEKTEWDWQLNIYTWLARQHGIPIEKASIWAILRDWSQYKSLQDHDYPKIPFMEKPISLRDENEVETFIANQLAKLAYCSSEPDEHLPLCTPEERWASPTTYAVMKKGNKRASKVCDTYEEAKGWADHSTGNYEIVERPGEDKRCLQYCAVAPWCNYAKELTEPKPSEGSALKGKESNGEK